MQLNPTTDWMFTADPGKAGLGLKGRRVPVPHGKMLGGSSGINYMMYVRGHPGDFDSWAAGGAIGWSYAEVLPYFRKSEGLAASDEIVIDAAAHNTTGPSESRCVTRYCPARQFVEAAVAAGIARGDYNGRNRGGPNGVVSLTQYTMRDARHESQPRSWREMDSNIGPAREKLHSGAMWFPRTAPLASRPRGNSQLQTADYLQPATISHLAIILRTFRSFGPGTRSTGISRC